MFRKKDIKNPNSFDLEFNGFIIHGNYQAARDTQAIIDYITKDDVNFLTNMSIDSFGTVMEPEQHLFSIIASGGTLSDVSNILRSKYKDLACKRYRAIMSNMRSIYNL